MFAHDPTTNRLSLKGEFPPWISCDNKAWNYCIDCHDKFFSTGQKTVHHVPFRDRASQSNMKISWRERKRRAEEIAQDEVEGPSASQSSQVVGTEPGGDALAGLGATEGDEDKTVDDAIFEHDAPDNEEDGPPPALVEEAPAPLEPAGEEEDAPGEDGLPMLPTERRPTLQEYKSKWQTKLAEHSREVDGGFSNENLCPQPVHQLWQDCIRLSCSR